MPLYFLNQHALVQNCKPYPAPFSYSTIISSTFKKTTSLPLANEAALSTESRLSLALWIAPLSQNSLISLTRSPHVVIPFSLQSILFQVASKILVAKSFMLSLIHISEPTRQAEISYAVFCLKKKKKSK